MAQKRDSKGRFSGSGSSGAVPRIPAKKRAALLDEVRTLQRMLPKKGPLHPAMEGKTESRAVRRKRAADSYKKERKRVRAYEARKARK